MAVGMSSAQFCIASPDAGAVPVIRRGVGRRAAPAAAGRIGQPVRDVLGARSVTDQLSSACGDSAHRLTDRKVPARSRIASNSATALPHAVMTSEVSATRATSSPRSRAGPRHEGKPPGVSCGFHRGVHVDFPWPRSVYPPEQREHPCCG